MSSWVKVTRGQQQKPVEKRHRPSWIPRLLDINPYKSSQKNSFGHDSYPRDLEDQNSFDELFGQKYQYPPGPEEYCERYQYSQNEPQYSTDDRREKLYMQFYQQIQAEYHKERPSDCVIVAISKEQMEYATAIGHQLQDHGIVVEMIYLTSESGLTRALQEVKNDGSPFCILVEQSNVALSSCTAIILHDSIKIHRNMPMEDALTLVVNSFGKIFGEREQQERNEISHKAADLADDYLEREHYESYSVPLDIRHLLFLLSDGKYLYGEELKAISDYLKTRITELEAFETADPEVNPMYETHSGASSHHLDKPPPLLPTPGRNQLLGQGKPTLFGDRPQVGLLPTPGYEQNNQNEDNVNAMYEAKILSNSSSADVLDKPPPLLPTPGRTPLLGHGKMSMLRDRPSVGLLPTPGQMGGAGPKGKPPPLLAMSTKRPGLLGFSPHQQSPHQQSKRPLLGEKKPGLLPIPGEWCGLYLVGCKIQPKFPSQPHLKSNPREGWKRLSLHLPGDARCLVSRGV
ncbi:uncharacterized protein LOC142470078 isoform X3 [Ascaphus truei]|uniref:uncharacterized protein LOC142470078 isoform X3 n=1 Tax=Ascaphus truei TaxID=8439 RepID=UPI003F5AB0DE